MVNNKKEKGFSIVRNKEKMKNRSGGFEFAKVGVIDKNLKQHFYGFNKEIFISINFSELTLKQKKEKEKSTTTTHKKTIIVEEKVSQTKKEK